MAQMTRLPQLGKRPVEINRAIFVLWLSLGIGVLKTILAWSHLEAMSRSTTSLVSNLAFTFAIMALLFWKIGQGRNWARITFLVLTILGTGLELAVPVLRTNLQWSTILGVLGLVQIALQLYALGLVFTAPGRDWFRSQRA